MAQRQWTKDEKLLALMALPWDVQVVAEEDGSFFAKVSEIPDAVADGEDERELAREIWQSLYASLALRLDRAMPITLPDGCALPWEVQMAPPWHPDVAEAAGPLVLHGAAYKRALQAAGAAGDFAVPAGASG